MEKKEKEMDFVHHRAPRTQFLIFSVHPVSSTCTTAKELISSYLLLRLKTSPILLSDIFEKTN